MSEQKPFIIFVEGNIATGKSTFLSLIAKHLKNIQAIHEPVDKWTQLKDSNDINICVHVNIGVCVRAHSRACIMLACMHACVHWVYLHS